MATIIAIPGSIAEHNAYAASPRPLASAAPYDPRRAWLWGFLAVVALSQVYFVRELLGAFLLFCLAFCRSRRRCRDSLHAPSHRATSRCAPQRRASTGFTGLPRPPRIKACLTPLLLPHTRLEGHRAPCPSPRRPKSHKTKIHSGRPGAFFRDCRAPVVSFATIYLLKLTFPHTRPATSSRPAFSSAALPASRASHPRGRGRPTLLPALSE